MKMSSSSVENKENEENNSLYVKDSTISDLKARLFDLEQQEKDFNALKQRLSQLKRDYAILTNTHDKLDQELKQKDDSYNRRIASLRSENENLQQSYNEKLSLNKKLFTENDALEKEIEQRDAELNDLKNKLRDLNNQLNHGLGDKSDLENQLQRLRGINNSQLNEINKLTNENKKLNDIANDQERQLQREQEEIAQLKSKSSQNDSDIENLNNKLKNLISEVNNAQNILDKNNVENRDLKGQIKNLECQSANLKFENNNLNNCILKEKACREERERENQQLNNAINDYENQLNDLTDKFNVVKESLAQVSDESKNFQNKNGKLKGHIMLLTKQNQKLLGELENVKDQDLRLKTLLSRKDKSSMILKGVKGCIENSKISMEKTERDPMGYCDNYGMSGERVRFNSSEHYGRSSPRYCY